MRYRKIIILLLLVVPILLFTQQEQGFLISYHETKKMLALLNSVNPSIEDLPYVIQGIFMDEISRNVTIDSLNKLMIERAVWDTLNVIGLDIINAGLIVELEIDLSIREVGNETLIDVTLQIVYDRSGATKEAIDLFIRDRQNIVLSTTHQRMIKSFTIELDDDLFIAETEVQRDIDIKEVTEVITSRRPGVFLIVENGVFQGYSYRDIETRAFENRRLTDVNIPDGILTIGARAFANNRLSVINIPHSVTSIETSAFVNNRPTLVSIGANVQLGKNAIGRGFETFYNRNDRRAGIYVYERGNWSWGLR